MAECLLINPQMPFHAPKEDSWIRLGLAQLATMLSLENADRISLIDFRNLMGWWHFQIELNRVKPDFIFISVFTAECQEAIKAARIIRKQFPDAKITVGGIHASIAPEDYQRTGYFDYIVRGEGELIVPKIAAGLIKPGTYWGEPPDLNNLPLPMRNLWPDYKERIQHPPPWLPEKPWVDVLNYRGCYGRCRFCSGPGEQNHFAREVGGKIVSNIRGRSVSTAISELLVLDSDYHFRSIHFSDDQFIMNTKWTWDFLAQLKEYNLDGRQWWAGSRADVILRNKPLVLEMQKCGMDIMSVGFESFSDELLTFWDKGTTAQQNIEAAQFLKENGIKIFSNTIMGAPRPDGKWHKEDDLKTIEILKKMKPDFLSWSIFTAVPGSELYQWCIDRDLVSPDMNWGYRFPNEDKIKGISCREVQKMMDDLPGVHVNIIRKALRKGHAIARLVVGL